MDQPSKQRKRDAVGNLHDLAVDIGVDVAGRRKADLAESEQDGASHTAQGMRLQTNPLAQAEERIHGLPLDLLLHPGTPLDLVPSPWKPLGWAGSDRLGGLRAGGLAWGRVCRQPGGW